MKISKSDRVKLIEAMDLPKKIKAMALGKEVHRLLADHCREVKYFYEEDIKLPDINFVPLWEGHSSITGFKLKESITEYFKFEIEHPEKIKQLGHSIHGVSADLLAWLWTEEELEDEEIEQLSEYLEFPYVKQFLDEIKIANESQDEPQEEWEERFRLSLG